MTLLGPLAIGGLHDASTLVKPRPLVVSLHGGTIENVLLFMTASSTCNYRNEDSTKFPSASSKFKDFSEPTV